MRYHIGRQGAQLGPFTDFQVREQLAAGTISHDDLIWHEGMADWRPVRTLFPPASMPPPIPGSAFGGGSPFRSAVTREAPPDAPALASRSSRFWAHLADGFIGLLAIGPGLAWFFTSLATLERHSTLPEAPSPINAEQIALHTSGAILLMLAAGLALVIAQIYLLCTRGQTLGKMWLKIRIVRTNGEPAGFVHAFLLRTLVMGFINNLVGITALIDPFFIFREDRRCLHDLLADTTVIDAD